MSAPDTETHLEGALRRFPCGPGGHRLSAGLALGGFGTDMAWIPLCEACGKRVDAATCLFCEAAAGSVLPNAVIFDARGPSGQRTRGWVCGDCRSGATNSDWLLLPVTASETVAYG